MEARMYAVFADGILIMHFGVAAFNTLGLPIIWIGRVFRRKFVHNPWFRYSHVASMGVVLVLALLETICPFTEWEQQLRLNAAHGGRAEVSLIQKWVGGVLYCDFDWTTFGILYALWFAAILVTLRLVPVRSFRS